MEADPPNVAPNTPYRISDLELASRLSFLLWSTIPDDQLYDLAVQGKLRSPGVLDRQVRRMIADHKAQALVASFADQWLYLRNLKGVVPDPPTALATALASSTFSPMTGWFGASAC